MRQTLRLGQVAGIQVGAHWSVLVIVALLVHGLAVTVLPDSAPGRSWLVYWVAGTVGAALFLLSLLAHELAHAVVARGFGIRVDRINLWLLGGVAELADEPPSPRADFLVAAAGPATSLAAGLVFAGAAGTATTVDAFAVAAGTLVWLALVNVVLGVFNLLPGAPLDGGRVLRALLWAWHGDRHRAAALAARVGHGLGLVLVLAGLAEVLFLGIWSGLWLALVGWFLLSAANAERAADRYRRLLGRVPVRAAMHANPAYGDPQQTVDDFVANVAAHSSQRSFPLRDATGRPAGLVWLGDLGRIPEARRAGTTLASVATPVTQVPVVEASEALATVAPIVARGGTALVVDEGLLVGVVDGDDVSHVAELAALRRGSAPTGQVNPTNPDNR